MDDSSDFEYDSDDTLSGTDSVFFDILPLSELSPAEDSSNLSRDSDSSSTTFTMSDDDHGSDDSSVQFIGYNENGFDPDLLGEDEVIPPANVVPEREPADSNGSQSTAPVVGDEDEKGQQLETGKDPPSDGLNSSSSIDTDNCCLICTELWTNSEEHHVVSLKCGHLFGRKCIETWLEPSRRYNRCPTCNKPAKKRDIHKIYVK